MPSLSGSFSATGQTSATLMLKPGQSATYSLATWTRTAGFVALQRMATGGGAWETLASYTANQSSTIVRNDSGVEDQFYRILCKTADTLDYTLADVSAEAIKGTELFDKEGIRLFYVDDQGYGRALNGFKSSDGGFVGGAFSSTSAGAGTIGASGSNATHTVNGDVIQLNSSGSTTPTTIRNNNATGYLQILGGTTFGSAQIYLYAQTHASKPATFEMWTTSSGTSKMAANATGIGFFGATPVARQAHIADATDATDVITRANAILTALRNYGLLATS